MSGLPAHFFLMVSGDKCFGESLPLLFTPQVLFLHQVKWIWQHVLLAEYSQMGGPSGGGVISHL